MAPPSPRSSFSSASSSSSEQLFIGIDDGASDTLGVKCRSYLVTNKKTHHLPDLEFQFTINRIGMGGVDSQETQ